MTSQSVIGRLIQFGRQLEQPTTYVASRAYSTTHPRRIYPRISVTSRPVRPFSRRFSAMPDQEKDHQYQAGSSTDKEKDEWKHRAPYKIHENDEDFSVKWEGECHCGKVKYQLSRDKPLAAKFCHCTTCQRLHGAPFQWAAIFHKSDINFTSGQNDLGWYDPTNKNTSHHLPCKVSCAYCRSPIMDEGRNMILLFPPLIKDINSKKGREAFRPTCHMFYTQRVAEFRGDGIVKWKGLDNMSDLLDDDENVLVKYEEGMKSKEMDAKKRKHIELDDRDEVQGTKNGA